MLSHRRLLSAGGPTRTTALARGHFWQANNTKPAEPRLGGCLPLDEESTRSCLLLLLDGPNEPRRHVRGPREWELYPTKSICHVEKSRRRRRARAPTRPATRQPHTPIKHREACMSTVGLIKQRNLEDYKRAKLSAPAGGTQRLQPRRSCRVRCIAFGRFPPRNATSFGFGAT